MEAESTIARRRWLDPLLGFLVFACSLLFYSLTLTPSLSFKSPDGNELATVAYQLGLAHSTGYPLYTWLGKLFTFIPLGDVAYRVNLMSAVLGAGANQGDDILADLLETGQSHPFNKTIGENAPENGY